MNELRAFADGRWSEFTGLDRCSLAEADDQLGERQDGRLHGGMFGGEPTQFGIYPGSAATPGGLTVWVLGEAVVGLEAHQPTPSPTALSALGEPGTVIGSELGPDWSQELWPERGLVLHRRAERFAVVFGLKPFTVEGWESDPLRWWRIERRPTRR
ncbi:hypothetical protein MLP_02200 [Microlunatus phosphovorus NM-1]|uniref:Uncharacterized protein n=1 Tax=Microlunatus phosphovorus (strain ATCC 700054 / DSM 10555 / JCM 9379 / NBRC 101784 / NCIMB 13414 / VKM Ac-1990 / NM-1) TaxID=1032480 RepID=F5XHT9_MICPN|nr:hypothetical protein [Microlunatus phosphovorus]BAK33234.1 hypothetical protein MLP_02200 [Microlunatus phosphovorus NM-1]